MTEVLIPIVGMLIPIIIVPTALAMKQAQRARELEHAERMRALELGRTLPQDENGWSPPRICVAIGAGVPIGVFLCAWLASQSGGQPELIWPMAGGVGVTAVICGSLLAARHFTLRAEAEIGTHAADSNGKTPIDADAYDVVGSRG
jgi:hypothetical protein